MYNALMPPPEGIESSSLKTGNIALSVFPVPVGAISNT
jgi:hypothetical protein